MNKLDPSLISQMIKWRHQLHRHPEPGFEEKITSDFVSTKLGSFGIEVVRNIGNTGVVGVLKNGLSSSSIGLRADMDALLIQEQNSFDHRSQHDGLMHACGHDGHSTMLLGAARHLASTQNFDGTVYFIFQPDEEHGKGAQAMIKEGLFERFEIDAVYGLHNLPGLAEGHFALRAGGIMASESSFEITIRGRGGHSALPHLSIDPLPIAAQIVLALQTIVSRKLNATEESAVVSVTELLTDGTINVIPSTVTIKGDCRCFSDESLETISTSMERISSGICAAAGADFNFEFINTFPPTINSQQETGHAIRAAQETVGEENVNPDYGPLTLSEDFASMLRVKPGCYALLGNGTESTGGCALHNPNYDFNDNILATGANYWVQLVENQLHPV